MTYPHLHTMAEMKDGRIRIAFWSSLGCGGISTYHDLSEQGATELMEAIKTALSKLPRVADAADLGLVA